MVRTAVVSVVACLGVALAGLSVKGGPARVAPADALRVVTLGGSVTAGAACRCDPFSVLYGRRLTERLGVPVHVDNRGINGLDSDGLLRRSRHPRWDLARRSRVRTWWS